MAPESDEEKGKEAEKTGKDRPDAEKQKDNDKDKPAEEKPVRVDIDLENISQRVLAMPIPAKNYRGLFAGKTGVLYLIEGPELDPIDFDDGGPTAKIHKSELKTRKTEQILEGVTAFHLSFNGEKILYAKQNQWFTGPAGKPLKDRRNPGRAAR